jgi:hypothetical protein
MAYDINKRREIDCPITVGEFIRILQGLNPSAEILCDGDQYFFIHVEADDSVVSIDSSGLDEEYPDPEDEDDDPESDSHMKRIW